MEIPTVKINTIKPHQTNFVNSKKRYVLNSGGVGSGKTYGIAIKAFKLCLEYPGIFGLIGAQTYPLLRDTTLREFINIVPTETIKTYNKTNQHFMFHNGSEVIFRAFDDENKLKSLNLGFAAIEEMTDVTEETFKMLRTRMRQDGMPGTIFGATNPSTFGNWVYRYFIDPERPVIPNDRRDVIYSVSSDNFYLPDEYLEDLETLKTTNPEYYSMMIQGKWGSFEGLIYNLPMEQRVNPDQLPPKKKIHRWFAGLDFGFTHPTALVIIGVREDTYYIYDEIYQHKMTPPQIIEAVKQKMQEYPIDIIYCDSARPELIQDMCNNRIPAQDSVKDVFDGIMHVKGLIGNKKLLVNNECKFTLREFDSYIWDAKNTVKEVPIKANDDCFTGNIKIHTLRGVVRLKNVKKTDLIYTRDGFKKILKLYKKKKEVNKYKFDNTTLVSTPGHPVFSTKKMDFKPIKDLTNKDTLFTISKERYLICLKQKLSSIRELFLEGGPILPLEVTESISPVIVTILKRVYGLFTGKYGSLHMVKYQGGATSTIKMVIRLIIQLKIWCVSLRLSICRNMRENGLKTIRNLLKAILIRFAIRLVYGISQKKAEGGTLNTLKGFLETWIASSFNVSFVESHTLQPRIKKMFQGIVVMLASPPLEDNKRSIKYVIPAIGVEKDFTAINIGRKGLLVYTVLKPVAKGHIGKTKKKMTYNLTVDEKPEYFANGVLVHNCVDAVRYALYTDSRKGFFLTEDDVSYGEDRLTEEMDW